jgi:hypothetical protein
MNATNALSLFNAFKYFIAFNALKNSAKLFYRQGQIF